MNPPLALDIQREAAQGAREGGLRLAKFTARGMVMVRRRTEASAEAPELKYRYPSPSKRPDLPQVRPRFVGSARPRAARDDTLQPLKRYLMDPRSVRAADPIPMRGGKTLRDLSKGPRCSRRS